MSTSLFTTYPSGSCPISSRASRMAVCCRVSPGSALPPGIPQVLSLCLLFRSSSSTWPEHLQSTKISYFRYPVFEVLGQQQAGTTQAWVPCKMCRMQRVQRHQASRLHIDQLQTYMPSSVSHGQTNSRAHIPPGLHEQDPPSFLAYTATPLSFLDPHEKETCTDFLGHLQGVGIM